jgi:hypothetical protein
MAIGTQAWESHAHLGWSLQRMRHEQRDIVVEPVMHDCIMMPAEAELADAKTSV